MTPLLPPMTRERELTPGEVDVLKQLAPMVLDAIKDQTDVNPVSAEGALLVRALAQSVGDRLGMDASQVRGLAICTEVESVRRAFG